MDLFKEQPSNNRIDLLNFLSTKKNIKIMNDKEGQTLKSWLIKTEKRVKWKPDVIIYYFLSRHDKWINISLKDFNKLLDIILICYCVAMLKNKTS